MAQVEIVLPKMGESVTEATIVEWLVEEGDQIEEDQIVVDVSTDKAIVEIPSMYNGRITRLYYREADIAQVHQPLFAIEVDGDRDAAFAAFKRIGAVTREGLQRSVKPARKRVSANK